jgi:hypothetical protein
MQVIKLLSPREETIANTVLEGQLQKACLLLLLHDLADAEGNVRVHEQQLARVFNEQRRQLLDRARKITIKWVESIGEFPVPAQTMPCASVPNPFVPGSGSTAAQSLGEPEDK